MDKLVDFVAVVGVNDSAAEAVPDSVESLISASVLQRFPAEDTEECQFPVGVEALCRPQGWMVLQGAAEPTFFVLTLTDVGGNFSYCAVLTYWEQLDASAAACNSMRMPNSRQLESRLSSISYALDHMSSYAPKCLCLISRHPLFGAFRNILCTLYKAVVEEPAQLPALVAHAVHGLVLPPACKSPFTVYLSENTPLSISAHTAWMPPFADGSVLLLFELLGARNVLQLFTALVAENKIVFLSSRLSHLQAASHALVGLLYPLKFSYPLIPVLPSSMDDFMAAPTPFIMGRLSDVPIPPSSESELVVVDLDRGVISLGESVEELPKWDAVVESFVLRTCTMVLQPSWLTADCAFSQSRSPSLPAEQDRELRAVFLELWKYWLWGYRSCLTIQRIHETFHVQLLSESFLKLRHLEKDEVLQKVLQSQALVSFIEERGSPYRLCDSFDKVIAQKDCPAFNVADEEIMLRMQSCASVFPSEAISKIIAPTATTGQYVLPPIKNDDVEKCCGKFQKNAELLRERWKEFAPEPSVVPVGPRLQPAPPDESTIGPDIIIMQSCFQAVFEEDSEAEADKLLRSLVRAFKSPAMRLRLVSMLSETAKTHGNVLTYSQFTVISKLVNKALQADTGSQSVSLPALLLPALTTFCTELRPGVAQFLYTACQGSSAWKETSFWAKVFHAAVQEHIVSMYLELHKEKNTSGGEKERHYSVDVPKQGSGAKTLKRRPPPRPISGPGGAPRMSMKKPERSQNSLSRNFRFASIITTNAELTTSTLSQASSPMDLAAERLRLWPHLNPARKEELCEMEEATVYAQAILFASRMVWMQVPMESNSEKRGLHATAVTNFVQRFFHGKAAMLGISSEHSGALQDMVPGLVTMHRENLDSVIEETERRKSQEKERLSKPDLLERESLLSQDVKCYLLPDGRDVGLGDLPDGPQLLPAEGTLFVTTYRVIFKGTPLDCAAGDGVITRTMPVASILTSKRQSISFSFGTEGLLLQSSTFQVMRICFAADVILPILERIVSLLEWIRYPSTSDRLFCYSKAPTPLPRSTNRPSVTSLGSKEDLPQESAAPPEEQLPELPKAFRRGDRWTMANVDPVLEKEYARLKFDGLAPSDSSPGWRITNVNRTYRVCTTYPSTIAVPSRCTDEQVAVVAQYFQQTRFPVAAWRDVNSDAILLRSSSASRSPPVKEGRRELGPRASVLDADILLKRAMSKSFSDEGITSTDVMAYLNLCSISKPKKMLSATNSEKFGSSSTLGSSIGIGANSILMKEDVFNLSGHILSAQQQASLSDSSPLYIISNRRPNEENPPEVAQNLIFLPVECPEVRAVRHSFRKLLRACAPLDPGVDSNHFYSMVEESGWMEQIQCIMRLAGAVVDLIDVQAASVLICLEDGWDSTAQVSSLAQLCLDPFFRTVEGFEVLVEKEWLAFGHRFSRRGQHLEASGGDDFAPIFLQFLDAVHQILLQFPLSFEFNQHFLEFLAYHHSSLSFSTFTLDSEIDRVAMTTMDKEGRRKAGRNIWRHIKRQSSLAPTFYNLSYQADKSKVLRPYSGIADLHVWQYYVRESVTDSTRYDIEAESTPFPTRALKDLYSIKAGANGKLSMALVPKSPMGSHDSVFVLPMVPRSVLDLPVSNADAMLVDHLSSLLCEHRRLSSQVGSATLPWHLVWQKEIAAVRDVPNETRENEANLARTHSLHNHRRASVEVLLKGKLTGQAQQAFSYPHRFVMHTYRSPTFCDSCKQLLWGVIRQGLQCSDCGYNSHYRCKLVAPANCNEFKRAEETTAAPTVKAALISAPRLPSNSRLTALPETESNSFRERSGSSTFYMKPQHDQYHEGFLYKRGGIRKNWKMRWFVLNGEGMELCYYNAFQETNLRGTVDLEEVAEVNRASIAPGAPLQEGGMDGAFFEIVTPKRTYLLMARSEELRQKWMECIDGCIQIQRRQMISKPSPFSN